MKLVLRFIPLFLFLLAVQAAEKITTVRIGSQQYTGIRDVRLASDGRVLIVCDASRTNKTTIVSPAPQQKILVSDEYLPDAFLQSWSIQRKSVKVPQQQQSQDDVNKAVRNGYFREVNGVIYDLRKPQSNWVTFNNVKVVFASRNPAMLNITSDTPGKPTLIFVYHLPPLAPGSNRVSFTACQTTPPSKEGVKVLSRTYDCGTLCKRTDIPDQMLKENRAFMAVPKR